MATTKLNNGTRKNSVIGQLVRVDPNNSNNYIAVDLNILDVIGTVAEVRQPGNPVTINLINDFSQMEDLINELAALLALVKAETDKIDNLATDGLSGVNGSLAHGVSEIEHHLHHAQETYGNVDGIATHNIPIKFTVTGGDNAWGKELHVHAGDVFGGGDPTKHFDLDLMYLISVSAANKISIFSFNFYSSGADINCTTDEAGDLFTSAGSGLLDDDRVFVRDLTTTTGPDAVTVYHVVGVAGNDFQLSLTQGGAAVVLTNDGSAKVQKLTLLDSSTTPIAAAGVTSDTFPIKVPSKRHTCDTHVGISALSEAGETIGIGFLFGLHIYDN